jgi:serine/threonine-protein kinase
MATEQPRAVWCCSTCGAIYHKDYPRCPADGAEVVIAERDPLLGTQIGHYTIDQLIGEGGMGRVYLAHHANLPNKRYAVKVLLGDHAASAQMRARFTREAERASQLDHPNVVKVVDFGQTRHGLLYIVMDHVDGPSLVSMIADLPMPPARAIPLARAICKGLAYAHAAGIIHRDLKPENILVSSGPDGPVPRIVDFGLALSIDQSDARLTESGMTMGTPAFAAPEQLAGKPIDHRADLYAFGMTMFEMLTGGMAPFDGHILEVMSARTARDVPRITERAPHLVIPRELEDIVAGLTRRRPADRYAGAPEVIEALDAVRLGPEARRRTEPGEAGRSRRRWLAAGLAAACAGSAAAWYAVEAGWGGGARATAQAAPPAAAPPAAAPGAAPLAVAAAPAAAQAASSPDVAAAPAADTAPPAPEPAIELAAPPAARTASVVPPAHPPAHHRHRPRTAHASAREPAAPAVSAEARRVAAPEPSGAPVADELPAPVAPPSAPPPAVAAIPGPTPRELRAKIDGVDVTGSLPRGDVARAVDRQWAAIARCVPPAPQTVIARFTIGETRRAQDVRTTGSTPATNACLTAALAEVRTEQAPDVGDVQVTVRIAFVVKT